MNKLGFEAGFLVKPYVSNAIPLDHGEVFVDNYMLDAILATILRIYRD